MSYVQGESRSQTSLFPVSLQDLIPDWARVSYNVQTAVDAEHCLILHHDVTPDGNDSGKLEPMAKAAKEQLQQDELSVTADAGYSNGEQFQAREDAGIAYVPVQRSTNTTSQKVRLATLKWLFGNARFLLRQLDGARAEMALAVNA